jgi:hypothetical protein
MLRAGVEDDPGWHTLGGADEDGSYVEGVILTFEIHPELDFIFEIEPNFALQLECPHIEGFRTDERVVLVPLWLEFGLVHILLDGQVVDEVQIVVIHFDQFSAHVDGLAQMGQKPHNKKT